MKNYIESKLLMKENLKGDHNLYVFVAENINENSLDKEKEAINELIEKLNKVDSLYSDIVISLYNDDLFLLDSVENKMKLYSDIYDLVSIDLRNSYYIKDIKNIYCKYIFIDEYNKRKDRYLFDNFDICDIKEENKFKLLNIDNSINISKSKYIIYDPNDTLSKKYISKINRCNRIIFNAVYCRNYLNIRFLAKKNKFLLFNFVDDNSLKDIIDNISSKPIMFELEKPIIKRNLYDKIVLIGSKECFKKYLKKLDMKTKNFLYKHTLVFESVEDMVFDNLEF